MGQVLELYPDLLVEMTFGNSSVTENGLSVPVLKLLSRSALLVAPTYFRAEQMLDELEERPETVRYYGTVHPVPGSNRDLIIAHSTDRVLNRAGYHYGGMPGQLELVINELITMLQQKELGDVRVSSV